MTRKRPGFIRRTFRFFWRALTGLRRALANLLFLLLLVVIVVALVGEDVEWIRDDSILMLAPSGALVEQRSFSDPLVAFLDPDSLRSETVLHELTEVIEAAGKDARIKAMVMDLDELDSVDLSSARELGRALGAFRASGKPVFAAGDSFGQQQYLLASYADEIYLHPMGAVRIQGYGAYPLYFRGLLDQLKVDMHIFRVGDYKAAVEPYQRNDMSAEARRNNGRWLRSLWRDYTATVAGNRELESRALDRYVNGMDVLLARAGGDAAQAAVDAGLIDRIASRSEMLDIVGERSGVGDLGERREQLVSHGDYLNQLRRDWSLTEKDDAVAVVVAEGVIVDGRKPPGVVGGETVAALLKRARKNENIKAVVLRVDSPGGSAFASEVIREQLDLLQQAGKPVVASLGGAAASGGYWIAAGADEIWAEATTITGSIGIFGVFPGFDRALAHWGVHSDGVGTTRLADAFRPERPLNEIGGAVMQAMVENGYQRFIELVARARGMKTAAVHDIAQGQVWSGRDALAHGLVDELGGLQDALDAAAGLAGLQRYETRWLRDNSWLNTSLWQRLLGASSAVAGARLQSALADAIPGRSLDTVLARQPDFSAGGLFLHCAVCVAPQ